MASANDASNPRSLGSYSVIEDYLKLLSKFWNTAPVEHAKTKEGRSILRQYVRKVKSAYNSALDECNNDPGYMDYIVRLRWNYRTGYLLHGLSPAPSETIEARKKLFATLPYLLKTRDSPMPNDPYVDDQLFFNKVFRMRVCWKSFVFHKNSDLERIHEKYKDLWMKVNTGSKVLLSEATYLWLEVFLEKIVSIVTEWELHGIKSDEDDVWENQIPTEVVPTDVQNSFEDDELYQIRMQHHDNSPDSLLFYGLPVGTRLPTIVPSKEADRSKAERDLADAAGKLEDFYGKQGMEELGKVANIYLRSTATNETA